MKTKMKALAALLIAGIALVGNASAQITAFNAASASFTSPASGNYTINYTVANANDVVVIGFYIDTGSSAVNSLTYNGLTPSHTNVVSRLTLYYFTNPPVGASTFSASIAAQGQGNCAYQIREFSGVNLSAPVVSVTGTDGNAQITTTAANSFIFDVLSVNNGGNPSVPDSDSVLTKDGELDMNSGSGGGYTATGTNIASVTGTYNLGWTTTGGGNYGEAALAFAPVGAVIVNNSFTWTNNLASGDNFIGSSVNWTNYAGANAAPNSGNGETMQWIGATTSNPLWITNSGSGSPNSSPGYNINLTAGQTAPMTIVLNSNIRLGTNLVVASGAGGLTIQGGTSQYIALGSFNAPIYNPLHNWINNSANPVTFDNVYFSGGAGWDHTLSLNGTGNWVFNNTLQLQNGSPNLWMTVNGPGSVILGGTNLSGVTYNGSTTGGLTLNAGTLIFKGPTPWYGTGAITINGGNLDSVVTDLVMAGNNPQTWNTSFAFIGSENLDLGTSSVTLNASITITVSNNSLTVGGNISGPTRSLTKAGGGTLVLSGANTYSNTTVNAGTLEIAQATLSTNSTVAVSSGAVLQLDFPTTNLVTALVLNGISQPGGVYNATTSPTFISGTGSLIIPSTGPGTFTSTPGISGFKLNGANVTMTVTDAQAGDAYYLLASTNLALPINQWLTVATNVPGTSGSFTFTGTNAVTPGDRQQFYILSNTNYNY